MSAVESLTVERVHHTVWHSSTKPPEYDEDCFSSTYVSAQTIFRNLVQLNEGALYSIPIGPLGPSGNEIPFSEPLSTDIGWFGPEKPKKLFWVSCGHHAPLFKGAAVQVKILNLLETLKKTKETALVPEQGHDNGT